MCLILCNRRKNLNQRGCPSSQNAFWVECSTRMLAGKVSLVLAVCVLLRPLALCLKALKQILPCLKALSIYCFKSLNYIYYSRRHALWLLLASRRSRSSRRCGWLWRGPRASLIYTYHTTNRKQEYCDDKRKTDEIKSRRKKQTLLV